jgi:hypothetical protein
VGLLKLLTLPVTGPISGVRWTLETVLEEAERQYYDEAAIREEMLAMEERRRRGRIDEAAFERAADALLERLLQAREYHRQEQQSL